jgi:hypothetical protein
MGAPITFITNMISNFGAGCTEHTFFGLLPWYHYLKRSTWDDPTTGTHESVCVIQFDPLPPSGRSDILLVLLVIIDDLLRVAGLVAIGFVIWGGVLYMTSQGNPEQTQKGQHTIQNALLGLVFCIMSIAVASFIGSKVG